MLYIEKKKNILTLETLGADKQFIFKIFFYEGLLISFKGILIGFISGILICLLQLKFKLLLLPGANGEAFPISFDLNDGILVVFLVSSLSILASYFPVKFLVYKNKINRIDATID
jgi:lipoprotein-releasing system permease protein